jgi:acetyltransferase-like isoleucine patch superfamily enzyme
MINDRFIKNTKMIIRIWNLFFSNLLLRISNFFVIEKVKFFRKLRKYFLLKAGVNFENGDFFADNGLKLLNPNKLHIGDNVSLGHDNCFWCFNHIYIGSWTQTAKDLLIISGTHRIDNYESITGDDQEVRIGRGCWIGARVTILGGVSLGQGCVVAAGAVVKDSFPEFSVIGGVPAKVIRNREAANFIHSPFGLYKYD